MREKLLKKLKEETAFLILSILAGLLISIGAIAFLYITSINPNSAGLRMAGALAFNLGLLFVLFLKLKLFTGMNCDLIYMNYKEWYKLILCFIGNAIGCWIGALIMFKTPIGNDLMFRSIQITASKLSCEWWVTLLSSIMCGILITLAVLGYRACKANKVASILAVIFPIFVFVMIGADHSVANQVYFAFSILAGKPFTGEIVLNTFVAMIGNIIGGIFIPALLLAKKKLLQKDEKEENKIN